ncbi:MAG: L-lactate permease [Pyramidobacter sp.]|nr:L-lactate permease [Pyramidobacter sp.]
MDFFVAAAPIAAVLVGMAGFNVSSRKIAPVAWAVSFATACLYFGSDSATLLKGSLNGILDGARILVIVLGAFSLLQVMLRSGAMDTIKLGLAGVTTDMRLMTLLLAIPFNTFIEGAAGAGSPAALAAPFLVGLGMNPVTAASACLLGNALPNSWGGAGVTTIFGTSKVMESLGLTFVEASMKTGLIACCVYAVLPVVMLGVFMGWKSLRGIGKEIFVMGALTCTINYAVSNVAVAVTELTSLAGGLAGTLLYSAYLKSRREDLNSVPAEYRISHEPGVTVSAAQFAHALAPYVVLCFMLVAVRMTVPLPKLLAFGGGYTVWVGLTIFVCSFVASLLLRRPDVFAGAAAKAAMQTWPALFVMGFLLAMVNCMKLSGQMSVLAGPLAHAAGMGYPFAAVAIGEMGAFVTGTNLGSNLMFNGMHLEAAQTLAINPVTVVAAQNVGGALGNMICPNNVVAVCACVGIMDKEGVVLRKTLVPALVLLVFAGSLAMFYTYTVFPAVSATVAGL